MEAYRSQRGTRDPGRPFFETRTGKGMSRAAVYERVRSHSKRAGVRKRVSPHVLRLHSRRTWCARAWVW